MRVYFVRHGETVSNASGIHQTSDATLSIKGQEQAEFLANRIKETKIDSIYSSPFRRAAETSKIISRHVQSPIVYSDLITEIKLPSELEGKERKDPAFVAIQQIMRDHLGESDWHYSDEENFNDLKTRALKFIEMIELCEKENILVVTHAGIMILIILLMKFRDSLTVDLYVQMHSFFHINNTGITLMDNGWDGNWWLISWNDHGHLGYFYK